MLLVYKFSHRFVSLQIKNNKFVLFNLKAEKTYYKSNFNKSIRFPIDDYDVPSLK